MLAARTATRPSPVRYLASLLALVVILTGLAITFTPQIARADGFPPGLGYSGGGTGTGNQPPSEIPVGTPPPKPSGPGLPENMYWYSTSGSFTGPGVHTAMGGTIVCAPLADGRWAIGWTKSYLLYNDGGTTGKQVQDANKNAIITTRCNYKPASVVSYRSITCPVSVVGAITGPSGPGSTGTQRIAETNLLSQWAKGGKVATTCNETLYGAVNGVALKPGWWDLNFTYKAQTCRVRTYGGTQPDQIVSCGAERAYPMAKSLTVHCSLPGGWTNGRVGGLNFATTPDTCRNTGPLGWTCPTTPLNSLGGIAGARFQSLDDGKHRQAVWAPVAPGGVRNIGNYTTSFKASGSILQPGRLLNGHEQPMTVATVEKGADLGLDRSLPGQVTSLWVGYQQATLTGSPAVLDRSVSFSGEFPQTQVTINAINYTNVVITTSTGVTYVQGTGSCQSQPLTVDVVRARTSN